MADSPRTPDPSTEKSDPRVGTVLAERYRLDRLLGIGGMGRVYAAEHVLMRKRLAVKVLHRELTRVPEVVARFEREAMAAANIDHPNVAAATDFGKLPDGAVFLVLEYVSGRSLRDEIATGPLPADRALHIAGQMASTLAAAHALDIVHRDLKPENVMLVEKAGDRDFVKVLDFGIAKVPFNEISERGSLRPGEKITKAGMVFGTPEYMAPEQALGQSVDGRADLYGLGVILFEMLAGVRPYSSATQVGILGQQLSLPVPRIADRAPGVTVPPQVEHVLQTLLAREASERYASASEVVEIIDQLRGAAPTRARHLFTLPRGSVRLSDSSDSVLLDKAARTVDPSGPLQAQACELGSGLEPLATGSMQRPPPARLPPPPVPPPPRTSAPRPPAPSRDPNASARVSPPARREDAPEAETETPPEAQPAEAPGEDRGPTNGDRPEVGATNSLGISSAANPSLADTREFGAGEPMDQRRRGFVDRAIAVYDTLRRRVRATNTRDSNELPESPSSTNEPGRAQTALRSALHGVPLPAVIVGLVLFVAACIVGLLAVSGLWSEAKTAATAAPSAKARHEAVPVQAPRMKPAATKSTLPAENAPAAELAQAKASGSAALRALSEKYPRDALTVLELAKSLRRDQLFSEVTAALARTLALDEKLATNGEVATLLWQATQKSESRTQAFALLEGAMGSRGTDIAYDLVTTDGIQPAVKERAEQLLHGDGFHRRASEALKVAVALRAAKDCAAQRGLVVRAHESGDRRSLPYLQAMQKGQCLAGDRSLGFAIDAVQRRHHGQQ